MSGGGTVLYCISVSRRHSHSRFTELLLRSAQMASENVGHHVDVKSRAKYQLVMERLLPVVLIFGKYSAIIFAQAEYCT